MTPLPWQPNPSSGYIAHPEGERYPYRFATVAPAITASRTPVWRWRVNWGPIQLSGDEVTLEAAFQSATDAWWEAVNEGTRLGDTFD